MTSRRVLIGFGFGVGVLVAGAIAGLARVAGLDEPPAAIADVEPPAAPAAKPVALTDAPPAAPAAPSADAPPAAPPSREAEKPSPRWRTAHEPADVPAGVIARVASRRGVERPRDTSAQAKGAAGGARDATRASAPRTEDAGRVDSVEIDWHGTSPKP